MNWKEAAMGQGVGETYLEAELQNIKWLYPKMIEFSEGWIKGPNRPSLFLSGEPGCGKTYLMISIIHELFKRIPNLWFRFDRSIEFFKKTLKNEDPTDDLISKRSQCDFLFMDDVGAETITDRVKDEYFNILDYRLSSKLPFVFTSNFSRDIFAKKLGSRIESRMQLCTEIKFPAKDLRKEEKIKQSYIARGVIIDLNPPRID